MNKEILVFFKLVSLAFNTSFSLIEADLKLLAVRYRVKLYDRISSNILRFSKSYLCEFLVLETKSDLISMKGAGFQQNIIDSILRLTSKFVCFIYSFIFWSTLTDLNESLQVNHSEDGYSYIFI